MTRIKTTSELIIALTRLLAKHGNLPVGGESDLDFGVRLTVCDEDGHDAVADAGEPHCGPANSIFIEVV
ncbi:hypothetical protein [Magnetospirillum molischianum]|uniref:Uncharacterized protein n=1 Tax=Magnetospirillum molischianum DSM 120 TaxID=1150626 RepID=H8FYE0_MAGML|nr:hypothetical protein [Magnetospirillum molischianum]CCG43378.1 hypothetical protein PHAMO_80169 [Magnetospirillum molischianum DSM 120]